MPHVALAMVAEFHEKMALTIGDPASPDIRAEQALRVSLIKEEFEELKQALKDGNLVEVADALADLQYVINGAAVAWGIDLGGVFQAVHESNMTKTPGNLAPNGKLMKGPGYQPPKIQEALDMVVEDLKIAGYGDDSFWPVPTVEPSDEITEKIMLAARDQAKLLSMRDFSDDGPTHVDGIPEEIKSE